MNETEQVKSISKQIIDFVDEWFDPIGPGQESYYQPATPSASPALNSRTAYCFDHVAETLPPKLWDWAWSRSWEVFKAKHPKGDFKRAWRCWKIMPSSPIKQWPEGSGGLDKEGNPP